MKVLFAVHDEKVSSSIVKKYQKEYKEIISYKNVYYFNAIIKELQRDKTYDRIVIDEELEEFTSSSYEQKDKFIFDKLDTITDEAANFNGNDIPIILICSERRVKSEDVLVKMFGIGIYNAIIGNDRSIDEVARLINKPRSKKEAKIYYKIDVDEVSYKHEDENDVSEEEMQHILSYFKKLGKNEDRYVECFRNIVSQYNDKQMKIIVSILPLHVKSILEENSPEYQKVVASIGGKYTGGKTNTVKKNDGAGTSEKLLTDKKTSQGKPIVVPSKIDSTLIKKITIRKPAAIATPKVEEPEEEETEVELEDIEELENIAPAPKKRGRPRKVQPAEQLEDLGEIAPAPKRRGRPRKNPLPEEKEVKPEPEEIEEEPEEDTVLPGFEDREEIENVEDINEDVNDIEEIEDLNVEDLDDIEEDESNTLPGFEEETYEDETEEEVEDSIVEEQNYYGQKETTLPGIENEKQEDYYYDYTEYNSLLSSSKKVIAFVGTSKNGTSFIVNNVAEILAKSGIDTAILDTTQNKNSYYIYTKNDENLRNVATHSIGNLINGITEGVQVKNNLDVYTEIPNQESNIRNAGPILENLAKRYSAVLIDCDFNTPIEYFRNVQEIYLVQTMDVLTIQPLTAFLRDLKSQDILSENRIKIIINKAVKIKGVTSKTIVGGMAYYNDPEMSFMTELFDRNSMVPIEIPFDVDVYQQYLDEIINCEISIDSYPKDFQTILKNLACVVYPLLPAKKTKNKKGYPYSAIQNNNNDYSNNGFSNSVNNTLNNMKRKY